MAASVSGLQGTMSKLPLCQVVKSGYPMEPREGFRLKADRSDRGPTRNRDWGCVSHGSSQVLIRYFPVGVEAVIGIVEAPTGLT